MPQILSFAPSYPSVVITTRALKLDMGRIYLKEDKQAYIIEAIPRAERISYRIDV